MINITYALKLNNGQLAVLDFGQGTHITIYPTKEINLAYLGSKEEMEYFLNDYNLFKEYGIHGLFKEGCNDYQYHSLGEFENFIPIEVVKVEMKIIQ